MQHNQSETTVEQRQEVVERLIEYIKVDFKERVELIDNELIALKRELFELHEAISRVLSAKAADDVLAITEPSF